MKLKLVVLALGIVWASQAAADPFNAFYSFGDSSVDSGWWSGALKGSCDGAPSPCATGSTAKDTLITNAINAGGTGAPVGVGLMNTQILAADFGSRDHSTSPIPPAILRQELSNLAASERFGVRSKIALNNPFNANVS